MKLLGFDEQQERNGNNGLVCLSLNEYNCLKSLGLSRDQIDVYDVLLRQNAEMTAQDVASKCAVFPSAVYRCFYELERASLIKQRAIRPKSYIALLPKDALPVAVELKREELGSYLGKLNLKGGTPTSSVEIIIGGHALFERYILEISKTKKYMDGHSVGTAYSDEMQRQHLLANKRGVKMRYAFQEYRRETFPILRKWQDAGLQLRHYKVERGFHFIIFDDERLLISFVNPQNLEDRLSIFTTNDIAVKIFKRYFETIWLLARPVTLSKKDLQNH